MQVPWGHNGGDHNTDKRLDTGVSKAGFLVKVEAKKISMDKRRCNAESHDEERKHDKSRNLKVDYGCLEKNCRGKRFRVVLKKKRFCLK